MGWKIKIDNEKYRIWSTIVDEYVTDFLTKDELIRFLFWHRFENLMKSMLEDMICFPHGWIDQKTNEYLNCDKENSEIFYSILNERKEMFEQFFTRIKEAGIFLEMKDIDGVDIHTKPNIIN